MYENNKTAAIKVHSIDR